jgi:electron-transferring-flavoprotein dehydrogenase
MLAAEAAYDALAADAAVPTVAEAGEIADADAVQTLDAYERGLHDSWVAAELKVVRNCHAAFHYGVVPGMLCGVIPKLHTALY